MSAETLDRLVHWLDARKRPLLLQTAGIGVVEGWPSSRCDGIGPAGGALKTTPHFMTKTTRRTAAMSLIGSPSSAIMSAS